MNSSADPPARRLLAAAFTMLHGEASTHAEALRGVLATLAINLEVRAERFAATVVDHTIVVCEPSATPSVVITTSLVGVQRLLGGQCTLVEAIEAGELDVRGDGDALDAAAEAFSIFLHGLVRAPSGPSLLADLNIHASSETPA